MEGALVRARHPIAEAALWYALPGCFPALLTGCLANSPSRKFAGEEEEQGDGECWRVELGGLILRIVNHYLQHNLFLFSRGFTGTRGQEQMRNM